MDDATQNLVKLLRQGWRGETATDLMREAADTIEAVSLANETNAREADEAVAALEAVQPVTPHREALIEFFHDRYSESGGCVHGATLRVCVGWADALLAFGVLGQPQPQPDRETLEEMVIRASRNFADTGARTNEDRWEETYAEAKARFTDALLPLLGQPQTEGQES